MYVLNIIVITFNIEYVQLNIIIITIIIVIIIIAYMQLNIIMFYLLHKQKKIKKNLGDSISCPKLISHLHFLIDVIKRRSPYIKFNPSVKVKILILLSWKVLAGKFWSKNVWRNLSFCFQLVVFKQKKVFH